MPELPEVETCVRGLKPHVESQTIEKIIVREPRLRWPIQKNLNRSIAKKTIASLSRRAKYIVVDLNNAYMLIHLGMSGTVRIVEPNHPLKKHDHFDIMLSNQKIIRYNDPRRFGSLHYSNTPLESHFLIEKLGPEPLSDAFTAQLLYQQCRRRKVNIKTLIMNSHIVVGVGNIYANEALFLAGIHPERIANTLSHEECKQLCKHIKKVLTRAIKQGGTTLKDFVNSEGKPGYFQQTLLVYDRAGEACKQCDTTLEDIKISGRATVFCPACQE